MWPQIPWQHAEQGWYCRADGEKAIELHRSDSSLWSCCGSVQVSEGRRGTDSASTRFNPFTWVEFYFYMISKLVDKFYLCLIAKPYGKLVFHPPYLKLFFCKIFCMHVFYIIDIWQLINLPFHIYLRHFTFHRWRTKAEDLRNMQKVRHKICGSESVEPWSPVLKSQGCRCCISATVPNLTLKSGAQDRNCCQRINVGSSA